MILIANEFFDALPAQQYIKIGAEWRKNAVGIGRDNELDLVTLPTLSIPQSTEVQPDIPNVLKKVYSHIGQRGGAALIIDYGYWEGDDHTLQAVYKHKKVGILDQPGEVDLSVHVDFQSMAQQAESYHLTCNFQTQRQFLIDHGLQLRLQQLCEQLKDSDIIQALTAGVQRLIDPAQMGHLFKVLSICQ